LWNTPFQWQDSFDPLAAPSRKAMVSAHQRLGLATFNVLRATAGTS
jgi:hypothetical protein